MKIKINDTETIVDDIDYEVANSLTLSLNGRGYARAWVKDHKRVLYLHRLIAERAGLDLSHHIDHINRDKLDNRRENLRSATPSQNKANSDKYANNTSGFKGVTWRKDLQKWHGKVTLNGKFYHLGYFDTPEAASAAYQKKAAELFGDFALETSMKNPQGTSEWARQLVAQAWCTETTSHLEFDISLAEAFAEILDRECARHTELLDTERRMNCLEAAGIDNTEAFAEGMRMYREERNDE